MLQDPAHLGFRSFFVLAKLGHDLRAQYDSLLAEPFPEEFNRSLECLDRR